MDKVTNPFVYGKDPELHSIFEKMLSLQSRVADQFAKAEQIAGFGADGNFKKYHEVKLSLPNYRDMTVDGSFYGRPLPLQKIEDTVRAAITVAETAIFEADSLNAPILAHNENVRKQVTAIMTRLGVTDTYTTYDYPSSRSRTKRATSHTAGYRGDLNRANPRPQVDSARAQLATYISSFETWLKSRKEEDNKLAIARDEEAVKKNILGNPQLVSLLMQAGVNILEAVQAALPGKKADVVEYCISQAVVNAQAAVEPDQDLITRLLKISKNV